MEKAALKSKEHASWTQVSPGWRKHDAALTAWLKPVGDKILDAAGVGAGSRVLDIACGTGEPALPAARRAGKTGRVLAVDFVEEMLVFAREKAAALGLSNVEFKRQDGEALEAPDASFDAVTMRFGLMFMPEPAACLERCRRALKPGGRIALATWAGPEKNPWASMAMGVLRRLAEAPPPPPGTPGLFAIADPERLRSLLAAAGFSAVQVEPVPVSLAFADGREYFRFMMELAGPLASLYSKLPPEKQALAAAEISAEADKLRTQGGVVVPGVAWVASAAS